MSLNQCSADDQRKLDDFMTAGKDILQQIEDLRGSLSDKAKTLGEHLDVKPKTLLKSVRSAFKATLQADKEEIENVETILQITKQI